MDEEQLKEYVRCRKDPIYFFKTYGRVRHPTKGLLPFDLWDFQEDTLKSLASVHFVLLMPDG
jgi:hypothetical protein